MAVVARKMLLQTMPDCQSGPDRFTPPYSAAVLIGSYVEKGCVLAAQSLLLWVVGGPFEFSGMGPQRCCYWIDTYSRLGSLQYEAIADV